MADWEVSPRPFDGPLERLSLWALGFILVLTVACVAPFALPSFAIKTVQSAPPLPIFAPTRITVILISCLFSLSLFRFTAGDPRSKILLLRDGVQIGS